MLYWLWCIGFGTIIAEIKQRQHVCHILCVSRCFIGLDIPGIVAYGKVHIIHHTYAARAYVSTEHAQKGNRKSSSSYAIQDNLIYNSHFVYNSQHYKPQVAAAAEEVFICKRATGGGFVCVSILPANTQKGSSTDTAADSEELAYMSTYSSESSVNSHCTNVQQIRRN